jgi:hypothetical protein
MREYLDALLLTWFVIIFFSSLVIAHLRLTTQRTKEVIALAMSPSRHINHRVSSLLPGVTVALLPSMEINPEHMSREEKFAYFTSIFWRYFFFVLEVC